MNIFVLFFCFFSALCVGNTAKVNIFTAAVGKTASIVCFISLSGSRKFFCKNECEAEDILIKTDDVSAQSGRYSITYRNGSSGVGFLTVIFTNLTKSDSGRYRCGLGKTLVPDSHTDFDVRVSDALQDGSSGFIRTETEGENITFVCFDTVYGEHKFLCRGECKKQEDILIETDDNRAQTGRYSIEHREGSIQGLYVTIKQATKSDTGQYKCGYGRALSPDSFYKLSIIVTDAPTTFQPFPASASTPTTTQSLSSSSGFPSSVSTETTDQFTAPTTFQPFPASASTPTTTQSLSSSSGFPSSVPTETTDQFKATSHVSHPGSYRPLVVCVFLVGVLLLVVVLLLLSGWRTRRNVTSNSSEMFPVIYKNLAQGSTCEDSAYETRRC